VQVFSTTGQRGWLSLTLETFSQELALLQRVSLRGAGSQSFQEKSGTEVFISRKPAAPEAVRVSVEMPASDERYQAIAPPELLLNTCTVTASADQDARAAIRKINRENPGAKILVTGCYAQRAPQEVAALDGVTWVLGNSHKHLVAEIATSQTSRDFVSWKPLRFPRLLSL